MKALLVLAAISISPAALAQTVPPKVGNVPLAEVKPKALTGCKLVGTLKGTPGWRLHRLWTRQRGLRAYSAIVGASS